MGELEETVGEWSEEFEVVGVEEVERGAAVAVIC